MYKVVVETLKDGVSLRSEFIRKFLFTDCCEQPRKEANGKENYRKRQKRRHREALKQCKCSKHSQCISCKDNHIDLSAFTFLWVSLQMDYWHVYHHTEGCH